MPKEEELRITVCSGTYTFIIYKNEWRVHCLRYDEPWMLFEHGHKALIAIMYTLHDAEEYAKQLEAENANLKEALDKE
ncbi:MAG TPA: hypothetical protein HPP87_10050 [Planctomycetes bacterium]|nr:hypothetical protein [Planctomycetota bacterium]